MTDTSAIDTHGQKLHALDEACAELTADYVERYEGGAQMAELDNLRLTRLADTTGWFSALVDTSIAALKGDSVKADREHLAQILAEAIADTLPGPAARVFLTAFEAGA